MRSPSTGFFAGGTPKKRLPVDWILLAVAVAGIATMLIASSSASTSEPDPGLSPRLAVGMTPTDQAITIFANVCSDEQVSAIALVSAEDELLLWEAIATQPTDRNVFIIGQPPNSFVETVPLLTERPRGILLRVDVTTTDVYSVDFHFADLLPGLWMLNATYYPDETIGEALGQPTSCPGSTGSTSAGRRVAMVIGFLTALGSGAVVAARRIVPSRLE